MLVNHPMLVGPPVVTESPLVGSNKVCFNTSAIVTSFDLDPSDYITGLEDGDYVILVTCSSGILITNGPNIYNANWTSLFARQDTGAVGGRRSGIYGRFWDSGNPEDTFAVNVNGSGSTCLIIYAFRGLSRRKPVDLRWWGIQNAGFAGHIQSPYFPAWRPHQDGLSGALAMQVALYEDPGSVTGALCIANPSNLLHNADILDFDHQESGFQHAQTIIGVHYTDRLQNTTGSLNDVVTHDEPGFTLTNLSWQESTPSGDFDEWLYYSLGGGATSKYLEATIDATEGDIISLTGSFQGQQTASTNDGHWAAVLESPSGVTYGCGFTSENMDDGFDGSFDFLPDNHFLHGSGGGNLGKHSALIGVAHEAEESGTWTARFHILKEDLALAWNAGASSGTHYTTFTRYHGAGLALNGVPFIHGSFDAQPTEFSYDDYVPPLMMRVDTSTGPYVCPDHLCLFTFELILEDATLKPSRLLADERVSGILWDDANNLDTAGSSQPKGMCASFPLAADSFVLPSYRLTEGGADTDGKYYWELTVSEATASQSFKIAVLHAGNPWQSTLVNPLSATSVQNDVPCLVRGDGVVTTYGSSLGDFGSVALNDVFSFALDIPGGTLDVYRNGVLLHSIPSSGAEHSDAADRSARCFAVHLQDTLTDHVPVIANFTGPFTYTKPAGYVAWDFLNEA